MALKEASILEAEWLGVKEICQPCGLSMPLDFEGLTVKNCSKGNLSYALQSLLKKNRKIQRVPEPRSIHN